jgi:hypothetical protein
MLSAEAVIKLRLRKLRRIGFIVFGALGAMAGFLNMNGRNPVSVSTRAVNCIRFDCAAAANRLIWK